MDEIVLVVWSSEERLEPTVRELAGGSKIKVTCVGGETEWIPSRAFNHAVNTATHTHSLHTGCDYGISQTYLSAHPLNYNGSSADMGNRSFYAGKRTTAAVNRVHLSGALFVFRTDFLSVGGYDERIQTYGGHYKNLYERMVVDGVQRRIISNEYIKHMAHVDSERRQSVVGCAALQLSLNEELLSTVNPWNVSMHHSEYTAADGTNSVTTRAVFRPQSLRHTVNLEDYAQSRDLVVGRSLHDSYEIPWDLIIGLSREDKIRRFFWEYS